MELPAEIGQLTRLRMLDLRGCNQLEVIQPNVISNLTSLEELYVERSFQKWDRLQRGNGDKRNASPNELKHLDKLTTLHLEIVDIKAMPKDLFSGKTLEQYKIAIGCALLEHRLIESASRCLVLSSLDENRVLLQEHGLKMLLESTQILSLDGFVFVGVDNFVYELDEAGFPKLKLFELKNNHTVQCLINSMEQNHPRCVFRSLEKLLLENLGNLEKICDGELTKESFERLRFIRVKNCKRLKNLLPFSMSKLKEIEIDNCIAMEEIIVSHEEGDNSKEVIGNFPELCSLRMINVPRLKSFCSNRSEKGKQPVDLDSVTTLFSGKLVSFPILKILELSKCHDLTRIWDYQILPSYTSSFRSLTELVVKGCYSLEYLFPYAIAKSFVQLKSIVIGGCRSMKEIVRNSEKMEKILSFPNLDSLKIENLPRLAAFSSEIYIDFPVFTKLYMENCPKFSTFISKSKDKKLPSLFNENVAFPSLKSLYISSMNKPKIIANNADVFSKLAEVDVSFCYNLRKIFTSSMQRTLGSLKMLSIESCALVEEVFEIQTSSVEIITQDTIPSQLISLRLFNLPKLAYVWGKDPRGTLTFAHLEDVQVYNCPSLKSIFPLSVAKGLSKLRKLFLCNCGIEEIVEAVGTNHVPVQPEFVFPQLEEMKLEYLENLVCFYPGLHTSSWPSLKSLVLESCEKVKVLASELSSFQEKHVLHDRHSSPIPLPLIFSKFDPFPNLEKLELLGCNLEKICDGELRPNSGYFRKLISLKVEYCEFLKNLFSAAEAANFEQLCALGIKNCTMMEEIMSKNEKVDKVQFGKLSHLFFENLPNLVSFSSEIFIEFPLLTEISIGEDCPKFKTFISKSEGKDCTTMTSLFNDKVAFPSLHTLKIEGLAELKMMWQYKLSSADSFSKLEYVEVHKCSNLVNIFPSSVQRRLQNLKKLEISDCEMVEEVGLSAPSMVPMISQDQLTEYIFGKLEEINVYEVKSLTKMFSSNELRSLHNLRKLVISNCEMLEVVFEFQISNNDHRLDHEMLEVTIPFHLTKLTLSHLPKLKHVWGNDPGGTFTFQDLQMLDVDKCQCLKILFPASVAKNLLQLQQLYIQNCGIEQIVAKEEGQNQTMPTFVFPRLNSLKLHNLPQLMSFYPGLHTLKWPLLRWLQITCFMKAEDLSVRFLHFQQTSGLIHDQHTSSFQEPLFSIDEVTSSSQNEDLVGDKEECAGALSRLSRLRLHDMPNLLHFREQSSQPKTVFQNLIDLDILRCGRIKKLVSSSMSFQNLISLRVTQCHGMLSLLPSQTAKSMARLERLTICDCKRMTAIIADIEEDGDYDTKGKIVFRRLKTLTLSYLPSLRSFYSGKYMIGFPDLKSVFVNRCFEMKSFSEHGHIISSPNFHNYFLDYDTTMYGRSSMINRTILQHWESHPSTALQQLFTDKNVG